MSAGRIHTIARTALGLLAGGSFVGLSSAGYVDGAPTDAGVDGGLLRDAVTGALTLGAVWYPKLTRFRTFWRSLTNDERVDQLQTEVAELRQRLQLCEASEVERPRRRRVKA